MKVNVAEDNVQSVTLKCYPLVMHFWKEHKVTIYSQKHQKYEKQGKVD